MNNALSPLKETLMFFVGHRKSDDDAPETLAKLNSICAKSEQKAKEEI